MMAKAWNRIRGNRSPEYAPLPLSEKEPFPSARLRQARLSRQSVVGLLLCSIAACSAFYGLVR